MDSLVPPPDPKVPTLLEHRTQAKKSENLIKWGRRVFIGVLTIAVILLLGIAYQNRDLGSLAERQRQQFIDCKDVPASTPGCDKPVVSKGDVEKAKDGSNGLPGLPGARGPRGLQGPQGPPPSFAAIINAVNAIIQTALREACDGTCKGATGGKGDKGDSIKGDKGDTVEGPPGRDGTDGKDGKDGEKGEKGDKGDPGETCPEGTSLQPITVMTSLTETKEIIACQPTGG